MTKVQNGQVCSVCSAVNSEHASVCTSCGSFLQNRVPTLDLFRTAWGVLEHPGDTFRTVARAEHKNYAVFLFGLGGILPMMTLLFLLAMGRYLPGLLSVLPIGVLGGWVLGMATAPLVGAVVGLLSGILGGDGSFRNALGTSAYALVPSIVLALITLPIQWLTFGQYQFTLNPHPHTINAASYWTLLALQGVGAVWSVGLFVAGVRIGQRIALIKAGVITVLSLAAAGGLWWLLATMTRYQLDAADNLRSL